MVSSVYVCVSLIIFLFFFSSRRRHTRCLSDWSSDVCSSDLTIFRAARQNRPEADRRGVLERQRGAQGAREIGRASCRERVWISVVDVLVKRERSRDECVKRWLSLSKRGKAMSRAVEYSGLWN